MPPRAPSCGDWRRRICKGSRRIIESSPSAEKDLHQIPKTKALLSATPGSRKTYSKYSVQVPCRESCFHGDNTGSNPVGDAKYNQRDTISFAETSQAQKGTTFTSLFPPSLPQGL